MRSLPALFRAAIGADSYIHGHAVEMDFAANTIERINTTPYIISINGNNFDTAHGGLTVAAIQEHSNLSDKGMSVTLSGIDPAHISALTTLNPQGRPLKIWEIVLNADHTLKASYPVGIWRMDNITASLGSTATVTVHAGSAWLAWDKVNTRTYTDSDQQSRHPSDTFFDQIIPSIDRIILWGKV